MRRVREEASDTQIIWLRDTATTFAAQCEECHRDRAWPPVVIRGALCQEADVGFVTCWRGHRVRVRRMPRARVGATPVDAVSVETVRPSKKTSARN